MLRNLLLIAAGYILLREFGFNTAYKVFDNVEYSFKSVKPRFSFSNVSQIALDITMTVKNNNPVGATIESFFGELFYSSAKLGDIAVTQPFSISANSEADFAFTTFIAINELPLQVTSLIQRGELLGSARIKGMLRTAGINIPIDQTVPLI